jgi:hypothetical protein
MYITSINFPLIIAGNLRPAICAYVVAHGITDLDTTSWPLIYFLMSFIPLPKEAILILFCSASIIHFAEDTNIYGSLLLHCFSALIVKLRGISTALDIMLIYLTIIHTPLHYYRCWNHKRFFALKVAGLSTFLLLYRFISFTPKYILINSLTQRMILSHIICELTHPTKYYN